MLSSWMPKLKTYLVDLALPRFKFTAEFELKTTLSDMGMPSAFLAGKANFAGMNGRENLFLSAVVHKAYVDVNEKGTEAAAATAVAVAEASAPVQLRQTTFRADHPFLFAIRDHQSGSLLFLGRVVDPR